MSEPKNLSNGVDELDAWRRDWSSPPGPLSMTGEGEVGGETATKIVDALLERSRRTRRRMVASLAGEALLGVALVAFTVWAVRLLPSGLALVTVTFATVVVAASLAFRLAALTGTWRAATETPSDLLALERRRLERRLLAFRFGWVLFAVQIAFFVPWIAELSDLGRGAPLLPAIVGYLWLALVATGVAVVVCRLERRRRAELAEVEALEAEWGGDAEP